MGGIAITSWAERYPHRVAARADAVALINTTTGDLLHNIRLLRVPAALAEARVQAAATAIRTFGGTSLLGAVDPPLRRLMSMIAVGADAHPEVGRFVFDLFHATSPAGRGGWATALVDHLGPTHIELANLTVPTLVIGSRKDRLSPMESARRIAAAAPNLARFVELPGGHCAILERPADVNEQLRWLIDSASGASEATGDGQERRISS
jgi:pimeloyl-ACP methyl ester carboxylesterase